MKHKRLFIFLGCEAVLFLILTFLKSMLPNEFPEIMTFPFQQIADGLTILSRSGRMGNGIAQVVLVGISGLPLFLFRKRETVSTPKEKGMRYVLCGVVFGTIYALIHPEFFHVFQDRFTDTFDPVIKVVLATTAWSIIILCIVQNFLGKCVRGNTKQLLGYLKFVLYILCFSFTAIISVGCAGNLMAGWKEGSDMINKIFSVVQFLTEAIPYVLDIFVTIVAIDLFSIVASEEQIGIVENAKKLCKISCLSLEVTMGLVVLFNLLQIMCMGVLSNIATNANLPIFHITFTIISILISRLLIENKKLRDENNSII